MHDRLARFRVNTVNRRREFFRATPLEVKACLGELTGELLEFREVAEAIEYRQTLGGGNIGEKIPGRLRHDSGKGDAIASSGI
jgi:hypothetical protein